jgi:glycosyltransferase involved in cell wall biosynthesis
MMQILFVATQTSGTVGEQLRALILALLRRGHTVTLVCPSSVAAQRDVDELASMSVHVVTAPLTAGSKLAALRVAIRRAMRDVHFDAVHFADLAATDLAFTVGAIPAVLDLKFSRSYYRTQQVARQPWHARAGAALQLRRWRDIEASLGKQFERVVVFSQREAWALRMLAEARAQPMHVQVIPPGVTVPPPSLPVPRADATLLFGGEPHDPGDRAALQLLVDHVMPLVWREHAEVQLLVSSDTPWPKREATDRRVQWLSALHDRVSARRVATLALAPHQLSTSLPNALLDAMIAGVPVLASSAAVAHLDVRDGLHVVLAQSVAHLARSILALLDDPRWRGQIARAGREYAARYHSWELIAADFEQLYAAAAGASIADWRLELGVHRPNYWRSEE